MFVTLVSVSETKNRMFNVFLHGTMTELLCDDGKWTLVQLNRTKLCVRKLQSSSGGHKEEIKFTMYNLYTRNSSFISMIYSLLSLICVLEMA